MDNLPRWMDIVALPLVNILIAFMVSGLVVLIIGSNPIDALVILTKGAFGPDGIGYTLFYATDFIFTGLGVAVAFHAGLFNIGGDGQATFAGLGLTLTVLGLAGWPSWLVMPAAIIASILFGAAWALIPAVLQAKRGSHIVITTIMFNFIASALMVYLLVNILKPASTMNPQSASYPAAAMLPKLEDIARAWGMDISLANVNLAFPISLLAAVLMWLLLWNTRVGYRIRTVGQNPVAAVYGGISPPKVTILAMMLSGGLCGLMAINDLLGEQGKMVLNFTGGAGFVGIAVSLMGRSHPFGIVLAAILFGVLYQGGAELAFEIPNINRDMIVVIQGMVILFAGALEHMFRPRLARYFDRRSVTRGL